MNIQQDPSIAETIIVWLFSGVALLAPVIVALKLIRRIQSPLRLFEAGTISGSVWLMALCIYVTSGSPQLNFVEVELLLFGLFLPVWCVVRLAHNAYAKLVG